jgi:hypothetical protein
LRGQYPLGLIVSSSRDKRLMACRLFDGARGRLYMPPNAIDEMRNPCRDAEFVFR